MSKLSLPNKTVKKDFAYPVSFVSEVHMYEISADTYILKYHFLVATND